MLANRTSRWSIGAALLCLALLAASWFLLITPRRADAAAVRTQAVTADSQAAQLRAQIGELKSEFSDLPKRKEELAAIQRQLPPTAAIPALVRDLQSISAQAGVSLVSISPSAPLILSNSTATAKAVGAGSLIAIPVTITATGQYFEASLFLKYLQTKIQRSFLVTGVTLTPAPPSDAVATTGSSAGSTATATASETTAATPSATATSVQPTLDRVSLSLTGSVFVLLDGTVTLDDVAAAAKAATAKNKTAPKVTPTTAPTGTPAAN
jgi:Tfp pilus assembly protein PilO